MAWTGPLKGKQSEVQGMLRSKDEIGVREQGLSLINMLDYLVNQQQGRENSVRQPAQAS